MVKTIKDDQPRVYFDCNKCPAYCCSIYERVMERPYPGKRLDDGMSFSAEDIKLLREICADPIHFELTRQLLSIERKHRVMARRAGVFQELERAIERGFYDDAEDAAQRVRSRQANRADNVEPASGETA